MTTADGRRLRGDRTRRRVAVRAAELASVDGLSGLTLGQLADDLGVAKSSVAAVFRTKEQLQLAAVRAARDIFINHVVLPAMEEPVGVARLRSLIEAWFRYVSLPVFPGGCFMVATAAEYDSKAGAVRDALAALRREWIELLASNISVARAAEPLAEVEAEALAFETDAIMSYANVAVRMLDDPSAMAVARKLLQMRLGLQLGEPA